MTIMTEKERIEWLLELQKHPEQLTDKQIKQMLADEETRQLVRQLGFAKRAFKDQEAKGHTTNVNGEWKAFVAKHAMELDAANEYKTRSKSSIFTFNSSLHKLAASFAALLVASGLALAAIHIVRHYQRQDFPSIADTTVVAINTKPQTLCPKPQNSKLKTHTFNNVPLDEMLKEIALAYHVEVVFENESARSLRFHFVWKRDDSLAAVVEKLNTFRAVNIIISNNKLIVR